MLNDAARALLESNALAHLVTIAALPSIESVTRGSRAMLSSLRRGPSDAKTISPSSIPTHTQLT